MELLSLKRQQRSLDKQTMDTRKKMCDGVGGCGTEEEGGDRPYLPQQTTAQLIRFKPQPFQHPFPSSSPFLKLSYCLNQMVFFLRPLFRLCLCTIEQGLCCFLARVTGLVSTGGVVSCSNSALLLPSLSNFASRGRRRALSAPPALPS